MKGATTRQQAINAKCKDCIYDDCASGNWRQQVTACPSPSCALYAYRPVSSTGKEPSGKPQPEALRRHREQQKAAL